MSLSQLSHLESPAEIRAAPVGPPYAVVLLLLLLAREPALAGRPLGEQQEQQEEGSL